jgi:hypothetical protein
VVLGVGSIVVLGVGSITDDVGVTGSIAGGVTEEEAVRDLFFLRNASGLSL